MADDCWEPAVRLGRFWRLGWGRCRRRAAHADELDWVVDLLGSDLAGALGDLGQASSWETLFDAGSWEPLLANGVEF
ncbi:hypothetical protein MTER_00320 [Mycolicibacter terrae]|uniref:Uncharacterized protein n=1 Tax=Mycolicibacter terrae TaxID=1788 RepID=A0AAD1MFF5_9MYCO|nr:hypothetical protein MTER_00320 [Mycolicibacter terrae]